MSRAVNKLLALLLLLPSLCLGAITATTQWDIQSTGNAQNGCGFDPGPATGTDYSQVGATPHKAVSSGTTSVAANVITFTDGTTVAAGDVNNVVFVVSGTNMTAGWYLITSVSAGVNGTWTVTGANTLPSSGTQTNMVANMGGSCDAPNTLMSSAVGPVAGNTIHIKNASYTRTTTISLGASGSTAAGPIIAQGYNSAHGDITSWAGMANAPILTSATNSTDIITSNGKVDWLFKALQITSTAGTQGLGFTQSTSAFNGTFDLMYFSAKSAISIVNNNSDVAVMRSEVKGSADFGINMTGTSQALVVIDSWIHGSVKSGISASTRTFIYGSVIDHNNTGNGANGAGVTVTSPIIFTVANSSIVNNTGSNTDGINFITAAPTAAYSLVNNILYGSGRYNLNVANSGGSFSSMFNAWGGAGTANTNAAAGTVSLGDNSISLSADPFVNSAANGNFGLNGTSGGGASLRSLGFPGAFPGGTMTGYGDVGAIRHQDGSGGGVY